jgi:hypothetical protein
MKTMVSLILLQVINVILASVIVYLTTKLLRVKSIMMPLRPGSVQVSRKPERRAAKALSDEDAWILEQRKKGNNVTT